MKKSLSIILCACVFLSIFLVGCTSKPRNSGQIEYKDKILEFMMTKEEIDKLLGESELVKSGESTTGKSDIYIYQYDDLTITFLQKKGETTLHASTFRWSSPTINTFSGVKVGDSTEKLEKTFKNTGYNLESANFYRIFYKKNKPLTLVEKANNDDPMRDPTIDSEQWFWYDRESNKVTEIELNSIKDSLNLIGIN